MKAHDLITSPAFIVIKAASEFKDKTTAINQLWQTDFTYLKIIGWGWFYLSTILDDYSRYIISWKLCTNMRTQDVTDTLDLALSTSGCDQVHVVHKPRLLSDNVLYAELLADLASDHYRIEVSRHVHSMAPFGFLVNDSLSHNKHRVRFCGSHRP